MFELILMFFLGLPFLYLGWRIWKNQDINLIISHHHQKVSEWDKKDYTREIGKAIMLMGIGMVLTGLIDFITKTSYGWLILIMVFLLAFTKIFKTQRKYNKGIF